MTPPEKHPFLLFTVGTQTLALPVEEIERVAGAAELIPLPEAPPLLRGMVNWGGTAVPVVDLRIQMGYSPLPLRSKHRLLLVKRKELFLAFLVETVEDVVMLEVEPLGFPEEALSLLPGNFALPRIGKTEEENRILCIQNLETLFAMVPREIHHGAEQISSREASEA